MVAYAYASRHNNPKFWNIIEIKINKKHTRITERYIGSQVPTVKLNS